MTVQSLDDFKFVAFDMESAVPYPEDHECNIWGDDMGVAVIATETHTGVRQFWYSRNAAGLPAKRMASVDLLNFLEYLEEMAALGVPPLSWNGQGFDFPLLGIELTKNMRQRDLQLDIWRRIRRLSAAHYDPMLQLWWRRGYPIGLDTAGRGMGCGGKLSEVDGQAVSGESAAHLWWKGAYGLVMHYVATDTKLTACVAKKVLARKHQGLAWHSKSGMANFIRFNEGLKTVAEVVSRRGPVKPLMNPHRALDWWREQAPLAPDNSILEVLGVHTNTVT